MKKWEVHLIIGIFALVLGIVFVAWSFESFEPIRITTNPTEGGIEIEATLETTFIGILVIGVFCIGVAMPNLVNAYEFYKSEITKK